MIFKDVGWFKHGSIHWDIVGISNDMHQYEVFRSSRVLLQTNKQTNILLVEKWKKMKVANPKHLAEEKVSNGPMISTAQAEMSPIKGEQDEARFLFYLETWRSGSSFLKETMVDGF